MPETPQEMEIELSVEMPPDVPMRDGEERFKAGMNLEDRRRREAAVADLQEQLRKLQGTSSGAMAEKYARSPSARRRQIAVRKEVERLQKLTYRRGDRWEGPSAPATVVNLNPVELRLSGELASWTVPAAPAKEAELYLAFRGRRFPASYMTIRTPHVWLSHSGTQTDTLAGIDTPAMTANHITPAGLAHQFYSHYSVGAADAQYMGGILIFEGDIHTIDKKRLERNQGEIWVPKQDVTLDGMGDVVWTVEPAQLNEAMMELLEMQRSFCDKMIAEGHGYATSKSDIENKMLHRGHRTWHNWALDMGYLESPYTWASERLRDSPLAHATYCPDCRTKQSEPEQYFCPACNAPFDGFKAFMAGKSVSPDRLAMYEGEQWDAILVEMERRNAKIAKLQLVSRSRTPAGQEDLFVDPAVTTKPAKPAKPGKPAKKPEGE